MTSEEWDWSTDPAAMLHCLLEQLVPGNVDGVVCRPSARQYRLFAVACCREVWSELDDECRQAALVAERFADNHAGSQEMFEAAFYPINMPPREHCGMNACRAFAPDAAVHASWDAATDVDGKVNPRLRAKQAYLLRDIIGNPWHPVTAMVTYEDCGGTGDIGPCGLTDYYRQCYKCGDIGKDLRKGTGKVPAPWLTPTVLVIAQSIYDARDWSALPILADALEDDGCNDVAILTHLRGPVCGTCDGRGRFCSACGGDKYRRNIHTRGCWVLDLLMEGGNERA